MSGAPWLPPQSTPLVDGKGCMTWPWYRFFSFVANERLAGISGDIPRAIRETRDVLVDASIPGATGIYELPS